MPNIKKTTKVEQINFLKSAKYISFTFQADKNYVAGDVYPSNDDKAKGIILNDVKVTDGVSQPVSVIVEGYILKDRLATVPSDEAITALKEIKFY